MVRRGDLFFAGRFGISKLLILRCGRLDRGGRNAYCGPILEFNPTNERRTHLGALVAFAHTSTPGKPMRTCLELRLGLSRESQNDDKLRKGNLSNE
jgi:hypothetical protein